MTANRWWVGALAAAPIELCTPLWLVLTVPIALLLGGAAWWLTAPQFALLGTVLVCAALRRFPWWLLTPDDPVSPFGHYEPTMRSIYARFGRYAGDVVWLAWRNVLYGLAYRLKPARFKRVTDYRGFWVAQYPHRVGVLFDCEGWHLLQVPLLGHRFELLAGWMVRGAVLDQDTPRAPINMEFRPMLSIRRAG